MSYDNRETCTTTLPSGCIPYTGYTSADVLAAIPECRANINDVLKAIQDIIDAVKLKLGDNTTLNATCLTFVPATATQKDINQQIITELCTLKTTVAALGGSIDPSTIMLAVDLLCLEDPSCEPATSYSLLVVINKLLVGFCNHETRIANIETLLNI